MQAQPVRLQRVEVGASGQSVAFGADVRNIEQRLPAQLPLESEGPALSIGDVKILLERAVLRAQKVGRPRGRGGKRGGRVGIAPAGWGAALVDGDGVGRGGGEVQRDVLCVGGWVADLIAAPPHGLVVSE